MQNELTKELILELKNEMKKKGFDIKSLFEKIGMSKTTLYNIFTFRSTPSLQQFIAISKALNISLNLSFNNESSIIVVNRINTSVWNIQTLRNKKEIFIQEIDLTDISENLITDKLIESIKPYILISNQIILKP